MLTRFIEATNGPRNYGKFLLGRFDASEWSYRAALPEAAGQRLVAGRGWSPRHLWMLDLQTGEGACFHPGGLASADLDKHRIWVCPLFLPTLEWLYTQDLSDLTALPALIDLPDAPFALGAARRPGPAHADA
jgi:hypothetical protein